MPGSFNVIEIRETRREQAEAGDDKVEVAVDACESVWRNHADDEVENPVGRLRIFSVNVILIRLSGQPTVARAIPLLRLRSGKISAGRSHGIGPVFALAVACAPRRRAAYPR